MPVLGTSGKRNETMEQYAGRLRQSTIPLYRQILEGIKQKIEAGELKTGDKLPSEQELMEHFNVSRRTVRTAVDELCGQGYLVRKQGKGTFVSKPKLHRKIINVLSFQEACEKCGMQAAHRLMACESRPASAEERARLCLAEGANVLQTQRVLTADGEAIMVENAVYPYEMYAFLQQEDLNAPLYPLLRTKALCPVDTLTCHLEMVRADAENARLLSVPEGEPLFEMRSCLALENGVPVTVSDNFIVASRYAFDIP